MKFLLDANMPRSALAALRSFGHSADHVRDIGLGDATDDRTAASAVAATATLVSRDLGFADVRRFPPQDTQGILVLRLPDDTLADEVASVIVRFLRTSMVTHLPATWSFRSETASDSDQRCRRIECGSKLRRASARGKRSRGETSPNEEPCPTSLGLFRTVSSAFRAIIHVCADGSGPLA